MTRDRTIGWGYMFLGAVALMPATYELGSGTFLPDSRGGKGAGTSQILFGLCGSCAPYGLGLLWLLLAVLLFVLGCRRLAIPRVAAMTVDDETAPAKEGVARPRSSGAIRRAYPKRKGKSSRRRRGS